MFKVHGMVEQGSGVVMVLKRTMTHLPRTGDILRFSDELYYKVGEVVWCLDEQHGPSSLDSQRINIELIKWTL